MFPVRRHSGCLEATAIRGAWRCSLWTGARLRVRNHDEKIKDMSRSVLPSTHRKGARDDRRAIHKRQLADHQVVRSGATPMPHRPLLGRHDIEAFAAEMARWRAARDLIAAIAAGGHARGHARPPAV